MKKRFTLIIIASLLMFHGASPWEGAAAVAPNGELPSTGFYISTNAFPRNTVVDITNIETGKSTRAIVSNSLNNPGLLAVVSREAAELIGMRAGSVSRIRMVQPADPMAYMRFTESMKSGTPEYDSGNVITEDNLADNLATDIYRDDTYTPPDIINKIPETPPKPPIAPGYIVDEPEWGGHGRLQIVDLPGYITEPIEQFTDKPATAQIVPVYDPDKYIDELEDDGQWTYITEQEKDPVIQEPSYSTERPQRDIVKDVTPKINEKPPVDVAKDVSEYIPEKSLQDFEKDASEYLSELPREEVVKDVPVFVTEVPRNEVVKDVSPWQERVEVVTAPPVQQPIQQPVQQQQTQPEQKTLVPVETTPRPPVDSPSVYGINPEDIIPGIVVATPERQNTAVNNRTPVADSNLPNTIDRLDRGKYYVQVAALSADLVENALRQIDRGFAPVVFKGTDNMYRILIGPLNQGESAAVLARFKSIGYKDAFVRMGG
jgi:hypothetical protein